MGVAFRHVPSVAVRPLAARAGRVLRVCSAGALDSPAVGAVPFAHVRRSPRRLCRRPGRRPAWARVPLRARLSRACGLPRAMTRRRPRPTSGCRSRTRSSRSVTSNCPPGSSRPAVGRRARAWSSSTAGSRRAIGPCRCRISSMRPASTASSSTSGATAPTRPNAPDQCRGVRARRAGRFQRAGRPAGGDSRERSRPFDGRDRGDPRSGGGPARRGARGHLGSRPDPYRLTRQTFQLANLPIPDPIAYPLAWLTTRVFLGPRGHSVSEVSSTPSIAALPRARCCSRTATRTRWSAPPYGTAAAAAAVACPHADAHPSSTW